MKRVTAEKVSIYKGFRAFEKSRSENRLHAPKPPALSTAPRPDVLNYTTNALFLQVVKSVVKTFCWCFFEKGNTRKSECFQGFSAFLKTHGRKLPARSQTSRATNCATPRSVKNIQFSVNFRKWSNLWSSLFLRGFFVFLNVRKSQHLQGFSAFPLSVELGVGHMLPKLARYQLRHTSKLFNCCLQSSAALRS